MKTKKKIVSVLLAVLMTVLLAACGNASPTQQPSTKENGNATPAQPSTEENGKVEAFPKFKGKDFDGNDVDESLFSKNEATLVNFWFNGCSACVNEMPALEKFNAKLREKGAELIGINVEVGDDEKALAAAKEILAKQGVTYRNLVIDNNQEARSYMANILGFPTTILVDKKGNIIGQPIMGSIEDEKKMDQILKMIDDLKAGKEVSSSVDSKNSNMDPSIDETKALLAEENNIFLQHKEIWDKLFAKIQKDKVQQDENTPYAEFLKAQIEKAKDSFSEEEWKTINEDLKKIEEIEAKIQKLNKQN